MFNIKLIINVSLDNHCTCALAITRYAIHTDNSDQWENYENIDQLFQRSKDMLVLVYTGVPVQNSTSVAHCPGSVSAHQSLGRPCQLDPDTWSIGPHKLLYEQ